MRFKNQYIQFKRSIKAQVRENFEKILSKYYYKIPVKDQYDQKHMQQPKDNAPEHFKFPFYTYPQLNQYFQDYLIWENFTESRPVTHYDVKSNLLFIIGPNQIGKSTFINYNLKALDIDLQKKSKEELEKKLSKYPLKQQRIQILNDTHKYDPPLFIQYDLKQNKHIINFDTFLNQFEEILINSISTKEKYLSPEILFNILSQRFDKSYINLFLKDSIYGLINEMDFRFQVSDQIKGDLVTDIYEELQFETEPLKDIFIEACKLVNQENHFSGAMDLILSVLYRIEHEHRDNSVIYHRTGIETCDFLFDVLNYLTGFHTLNTEKRFCHSVLIFNNFEHLFEKYQNDQRIWDLFDHILLRLYTDENQRTHFPIIIETNQSRLVQRDIFNMSHLPINSFPIIELQGYLKEDLQTQFGSIFQKKPLENISRIIGLNIPDWKAACHIVLQEKNGLKNVENLQNRYFEIEYQKFQQKINSAMLDYQCANELDENTIDFALLDILEEFFNYNGVAFVGDMNADAFLMENPLIKALIDKQILYGKYYYPHLHFQKQLYVNYAMKFIREKKQGMSFSQKLQYKSWKKSNGIDSSMFDMSSNLFNLTYDKQKNPKEFEYEVYTYHQVTRPHQYFQNNQSFIWNMLY